MNFLPWTVFCWRNTKDFNWILFWNVDKMLILFKFSSHNVMKYVTFSWSSYANTRWSVFWNTWHPGRCDITLILLHLCQLRSEKDSITYPISGLSAWFASYQPSFQVSFQPSIWIIQPFICGDTYIQPYCASIGINIVFIKLTFQPYCVS